ncbi:MAG: TetR/AcrR family transcriptional regulator [Kutzneria sp.]|nr:TetR/AcrR family transcriptional regulator [Kutzneria sp.]MBV9844227.1 TetR/AcrR family transcriptional regulator [Kutzneria sp.]
MSDPAPRRRRADAARNVEHIVLAARELFAEQGARAQLGSIARHAGVAEATLYRHFASKEELIHAVVERRFDEDVQPVIQNALRDADPWRAVVAMLGVVPTVAEVEQGTFAAAGNPAMFLGLASRYFESFAVVLRRAQQAGVVRADLTPEDLPRLTTMLVGAQSLGTDPDTIMAGTALCEGPSGDGWRRYLALLLDALRPAAATALPPLR